MDKEEQILLIIWAQHQIRKTKTEGHIILSAEKLIFQPGRLNRSKLNPVKETREEKSWTIEDIIGVRRRFPLVIFPWRYFEIELKDSKGEVFLGWSWDVSRLINQLKLLGKEIP
jgi:hypothetical protein